MSDPAIPRSMILGGALLTGVLLALAVHIMGQRYGLDLGRLWSSGGPEPVPLGAALAWWITAAGAFAGGYVAAKLIEEAASGGLAPAMRYMLITFGVVLLAGAGQAATGPGPGTSAASVLGGVAALALGAAMAFCGAQLALTNERRKTPRR